MSEDRLICFTEEIPEDERLDGEHLYRRGWAHFGGRGHGREGGVDVSKVLLGDLSIACHFTPEAATECSRKLLAAGKLNIYTYTEEDARDADEPLVVKYYTGEEYAKMTGEKPYSKEEIDKLKKAAEEFANQPRRDHKALASHILNLLFPDGISIKDAEWHGYNALIGLVNGLCSYCIDLQRGGAGGIITLMDMMKDTKTLLQMEGYSVGNPNEEESGNHHSEDPSNTE